jgi:hypothetical protein
LDGNVPADDQVTSLTGVGGSGPVAFATTHWSVVLEAQSESPATQEALEKLCRIYWRPIYSFVRRHGIRPEEAKDLTQGFFAMKNKNIMFAAVLLFAVALPRAESAFGRRHV